MVTFKGGWDKLYFTQHTLLSNVGQVPILFYVSSFFLDKLNALGKIMWHLRENLDECAADVNKE